MEDLARAFVSFFAIIDPVANVFVFHLFSREFSSRQKLTAAIVATVAAFVMLVTFALGGEAVLDFMGISREGFQIAAGLLLIPPAYRLVMEGQLLPHPAEAQADALNFALVPLATPLVAGPGALAATISFSDSLGTDVTIAAFSAVLALSLAGFTLADSLFRLLGPSLLRLLARLVGIVLFAIAVDFVLDGIKAFFDI